MRIEPKDVKKYLSTKGKIVVTGKHAFSLSKSAIVKVGRGFKKALTTIKEKAIAAKDVVVGTAVVAKDGVVNAATNTKDKVVEVAGKAKEKLQESILPTEEQKQEKLEEVREKRLNKIANKAQPLLSLEEEMKQEDEYTIGKYSYYLKEVSRELDKFADKRLKVINKGLGVFALTGITLSNIKRNIKKSWANHKEKLQEKKNQREIEKNKKRLAENFKEQLLIQEENKRILAENPELVEFYNELVTNSMENTETNERTR